MNRHERRKARRRFPSPQARAAQTYPTPERGLYLDVVWIGVPHFGTRTIELILLSHEVVRGERALGVDENSTPLLRHLLKFAH
jgi:hypothetical protein